MQVVLRKLLKVISRFWLVYGMWIGWLVLILVGFWEANNILETNLDLIEKFVLTDPDQVLADQPKPVEPAVTEVKHVWSDASIYLAEAIADTQKFFYWSYGLLTLSSFIFVFTVRSRMRRVKDKKIAPIFRRLNLHVQWVVLSMLALIIIGYCTQLSIQDPLHGPEVGFGQVTFSFGFQKDLLDLNNLRTNPFIWPSVVLLLCAGWLWFLYGSRFKAGKQEVEGFLPRLEITMQDVFLEGFAKMSLEDFVRGQTRILSWGLLGTALFGCILSMMLGGAFSSKGVTIFEPTKWILVIGVASWVTYKMQASTSLLNKLSLLVFGAALTLVMAVILKLLNDFGAVLIIGFVVLLLCVTVFFSDYEDKWEKVIGFGWGIVLYLAVLMAKIIAPEKLLASDERLSDWTLTDHFLTSGINDNFVAGTSSSPDFARAMWSMASGGLTGRGTGLFIEQGKEAAFTASTAFAYNDRAGALLIEVFGWVGFSAIIGVYCLLILNSLHLYRIPQEKFLARYGVPLGVSALLFAQVAVHFGGNFGFVPFTGIVLPFISHSGLAYLVTAVMITTMIGLYLPSDYAKANKPVVTTSTLSGMFVFVYLTTAMIVGYAFQQTIIKGPEYSSRIRYDIQGDKTLKRTMNPRLFLLNDRLQVSGQIVDMTYDPAAKSEGEAGEENPTFASSLVKNGKGEYLYDYFDEGDYFLHRFEQEHAFSLKGLSQRTYKDAAFLKKNCVLKNGEYYSFAGTSYQDAMKRIEQFEDSLSEAMEYLNVKDLPHYNCSVNKVLRGRLWKEKLSGQPVNDNDPLAGCRLEDGRVFTPMLSSDSSARDPAHSVWYFRSGEKTRDTYKIALEQYMKHGADPELLMKPLSYDDVSDQSADLCVVAVWHTKTEERKGVKGAEGICMVDGVEYSHNAIDENPLSNRSARQVLISSTSMYDNVTVVSGEGENQPTTEDNEDNNFEAFVGPTLSVDPNTCYVQVERAGCAIDDMVYIDQNDPDIAAGIAKQKIYFGSNRKLNFSDTVCKVSQEHLGKLKRLKNASNYDENDTRIDESFFHKKDIKTLVSNYEDQVVSLHKFAKSDVDAQIAYAKEFQKVVPQTIVPIYLHGALQNDVRKIVETKREFFDAPSVQALVFNVKTGKILAQAQSTRPRAYFPEDDTSIPDSKRYPYGIPYPLEKRGDQTINFESLYSDQGIYGYGKNNLANAMVPASTFKILHSLAAIDSGHADFKHTCSHGGFLPKDAEWDCLKYNIPKKKCSIAYTEGHGKMSVASGITNSCNQYFAALAYEHTHPDALFRLCDEKGVKFGPLGKCQLEEGDPKGPRGRAASLNGIGQGVLLNVYQIAGVLQAVSTNQQPFIEPWDAYMGADSDDAEADPKSLFDDQQKIAQISQYILKGMYDQKQAKEISGATSFTVYGKTGTGDHPIAEKWYDSERTGPYIRGPEKWSGWIDGERIKRTYWKKDLEKPYGVNRNSNMALFVALVEPDGSSLQGQVSTDRIGVVVRVPRSEKLSPAYGGTVAKPIAEDIIKKLETHKTFDIFKETPELGTE